MQPIERWRTPHRLSSLAAGWGRIAIWTCTRPSVPLSRLLLTRQQAQGRADRAARAVMLGDLDRMAAELDAAAAATARIRMAVLGAPDSLPPLVGERASLYSPAVVAVAARHAAVFAVLDDDRLPSVAPAARRAERAEAQLAWRNYHARLFADPEAALDAL
jgi:hypothetical protein